MNYNKHFAISCLLLFTIIIAEGFAYYTLAKHPKVITQTRTVVKKEIVYKKVNKINRQALVNWIYKNSFRCSYQQAEYYANIILKQPYPLLIASIIKQESNFDTTATNKVGNTLVIGLMQIYLTNNHIKQLKDAGIIRNTRDLFNPTTNIKAGAFILNDIIKINKGNVKKALAMYCGGSKGYARKVLENLGQLSLEVR